MGRLNFRFVSWPENKKTPLYSDKISRCYLKTRPSYTGADWDEYKDGLLEEFKDDDEVQKRYTKTYLGCLVQDMRKEQNPTVGRYRLFIFEGIDSRTQDHTNVISQPLHIYRWQDKKHSIPLTQTTKVIYSPSLGAGFVCCFYFPSNDPACGLYHGRDAGAPWTGAPCGPELGHNECLNTKE